MNGFKQLSSKLLTLSLLSPLCVFAQEKNENDNTEILERIEKKLAVIAAQPSNADSVKKMEELEEKIDAIHAQSTNSTRINIEQPLGDRTQGFEFNYFRLLLLGEDEKALSGTYSFFNTQNNTEIALPFMLSSAKYDGAYGYGLTESDEKLTSFTIDAHYRKYLGHRLDGFYLSAFARAAYLNGLEGEEDSYYYSSSYQGFTAPNTSSEVKLGLGFGIGYRIISDSGYYWGTSLSVGKYIIGESEKFLSPTGISADIDDEEFIIDVELLKFGFAF